MLVKFHEMFGLGTHINGLQIKISLEYQLTRVLVDKDGRLHEQGGIFVRHLEFNGSVIVYLESLPAGLNRSFIDQHGTGQHQPLVLLGIGIFQDNEGTPGYGLFACPHVDNLEGDVQQ